MIVSPGSTTNSPPCRCGNWRTRRSRRPASLGAQHADFRVERIRGQQIGLSDGTPQTLFDAEDIGLAVRVIVDGTWGFASAVDLTAGRRGAGGAAGRRGGQGGRRDEHRAGRAGPGARLRRGDLGLGLRRRPVHGQRGGQGRAAGGLEPGPARAPRRRPRRRLAAAGAGEQVLRRRRDHDHPAAGPPAPGGHRDRGDRRRQVRHHADAGARRSAAAGSTSPAPAGTGPPSSPSCPTCSRPSCRPRRSSRATTTWSSTRPTSG